MARRLEIRGKVADALQAALKDDFDPETIAVFETIALNTLPLNKPGSIYDKAKFNMGAMEELAADLMSERYAPLHTLHLEGYQMPVGRVFHAEAESYMSEASGEEIGQIRALFYLPTNTQEGADLIAKIESGVITDVSIGAMPKKARCSQCNFDYLGPEADFMNWWDMTCNEGHTVGEDGTYLKLDGGEDFIELSLVGNGAADLARIVPKSESNFAQSAESNIYPVAASGVQPELTVVRATCTKETNMAKLTTTELAKLKASVAKSLEAALDKGLKGAESLNEKVQASEAMTQEEAIAYRAELDQLLAKIEASEDETVEATESSEDAEETAEASDEAEENSENSEDSEDEESEEDDEGEDEAEGSDEETDAEVKASKGKSGRTINLTVQELGELQANVELERRKVVKLRKAKDKLEKDLSASREEITSLREQVEDRDELQKQVDSAKEYLEEKCQLMLVRAGVSNPKIPATLNALVEQIEAAESKLAGKLPPAGGVSQPVSAGSATPASGSKDRGSDAFRVNK